MTNFLDKEGLKYFTKRTHLQSNKGTIAISTQPNENDNTIETVNDIDIDLRNVIGDNTLQINSEGKLAGAYNIVKVTKDLPTKVKERYILTDKENTQIGNSIDIYYDSSLDQVYLGHVDDTIKMTPDASTGKPYIIISGTENTALCQVYILSDGTYSLATIDIENYLEESEFKDGLVVNNHQVSVNVGDGLTFGKYEVGKTAPVVINPFKQFWETAVLGKSYLNLGSNGVSVDLEGLHNTFVVDDNVNYVNNYITLNIRPNVTNADYTIPIGAAYTPYWKIGTIININNAIGTATSDNDGLVTAYGLREYLNKEGKVSVVTIPTKDSDYFTSNVMQLLDENGGAQYGIYGELTIKDISSASSTDNGLATAYDVQRYIAQNVQALTDADVDAINFGGEL